MDIGKVRCFSAIRAITNVWEILKEGRKKKENEERKMRQEKKDVANKGQETK